MKIRNISASVLLVMIFTGCSKQLEVNSNHLKTFKEKNSDKKIYIINNIGGNAGVSCNNKEYILTKNTYVKCDIESLNTIKTFLKRGLLVKTNDGIDFKALDFISNDNHFYTLGVEIKNFALSRLKLNKIESRIGMSTIGNPDFREITYFSKPQFIPYPFLNPDILYSSNFQDSLHSTIKTRFDKTLMKIDDDLSTIPPKKNLSKIIIYRKADNGSPYAGIWTNENFLGSVGYQSYIEVLTEKKSLSLITYYLEWEKLDLKLEAGNTYFVNVDFNLGWKTNTYQLKVQNVDDFKSEELTKIKLDKLKVTSNYENRINKGLEFINNEFKK